MKKRILFLCGIIFLASCAVKKTVYVSDLKESGGIALASECNYQRTIQVGDSLNITVACIVPEVVEPYNRAEAYIVNNSGAIDFPVLGNIHLQGLTLQAARDTLLALLNTQINNPTVHIRINDYKITVLGAVNRPGVYTFGDEKITILTVLGCAGDLLPTAKENDILVMREENGEMCYGRINLNKSTFFQSPFYILRPNDVVYVSSK